MASLGHNELNTLYDFTIVSTWKLRVIVMPSLSSLSAVKLVITTSSAANDDKVGIMITLGFGCIVLLTVPWSSRKKDDSSGLGPCNWQKASHISPNHPQEAFTPTRETRGAPTWIPSTGSAVDRFVEIVWCCLHRRGSAVTPQLAHHGCPQRSPMERFFCGTLRNRERWLVGIYRSMTQCCEMGHQHIENTHWPAPV